MYKLVKWAYDMGARQERVRVCAHLQNIGRQADFRNADMFDRMRDPKIAQRSKQRLEFDIEVERRIKDVIEAIMRPQSEHYAYSIMFPNDKHNTKER